MLAACASPAPRPAPGDAELAYDSRAAQLDDWPAWSLTGRLGITSVDEGGSGRLDWRQEGPAAELSFRGTLGQGAWRLTAAPEGARLELANGEVRVAARVEDLVREATGWSVPVVALGWWVRGLAWPDGDAPTSRSLNDDGTPNTLSQAGWDVSFTRYASGPDEIAMPSRLKAEKDGLVLKLAINRWNRMLARVDAQADEQIDDGD